MSTGGGGGGAREEVIRYGRTQKTLVITVTEDALPKKAKDSLRRSYIMHRL